MLNGDIKYQHPQLQKYYLTMTATYEIQLPTVSQYVPYDHIYTSCQSSNTPISSNMNL
jgi:hypothetical protein